MKLKIEVRQEHIEAGKRCMLETCPVALAASDSGLTEVEVTCDQMCFHWDEESYLVDLPLGVKRRLRNYDRERNPMHPFSFEVEVAG